MTPTFGALQRDDFAALSMQDRRAAIVERVNAAGVMGHGGGKFPTAKKLVSAHKIHTVIVNGMQSEPANNSDLTALAEDPEAVARGLTLVLLATDATEVAIALPNPRSSTLCDELNNALQSELAWKDQIAPAATRVRIEHLRADYASGQEHYLAHALGISAELLPPTQRKPLTQQGCLCLNVGTLIAVDQAVFAGRAVQDRWITVNGTARRVSIGTPVQALLKPAWINGEHSGEAAAADREVDAGVFCLTDPPPLATAPCINCGACDAACPEQLLPQELYRTIEFNQSVDDQSAAALELDSCIECGACNAVCPSGLWLTQTFRGAKRARADLRQKEQDAEYAKRRVEARQQRLLRNEQQKEERLLRRQQRERQGW